MSELKTIKYKFLITAKIKLITGMHIGGSSDFSPIGAIDSPVIKDPLTKQPIIPGSSIKGKFRNLLARIIKDSYADDGNKYKLPEHTNDDEIIKQLFGAQNKESKFQFYDLFLSKKSVQNLISKELDFDFTEIKFENYIKRNELSATPRQLERVPAGAVFNFKAIYNSIYDDNYKYNFKLLFHAVRALEFDYLGGSGSRGYGKVKFKNFKIKPVLKNCKIETKESEGNEVKNEETKIVEEFEKIFETFNLKKSSKTAEKKS